MSMGVTVLKKNADYVIFFDDDNLSFSISEWQEVNGARKYFCRRGAVHYTDIMSQNLPPGLSGGNAMFNYIEDDKKPPVFTSIKDVVKWMQKNRVEYMYKDKK